MTQNRRFWFVFMLILAIIAAWFSQDAHQTLFLPYSLDLLTATAEQLSQELHSGSITSIELVKEYVHRIERDNVRGLGLRAVINLVPLETLLETAEQRDAERKANKLRGPLHGIPIIVKDNMLTDSSLGVPTTFGTYAFSNATASRDAFVVTKLKEVGAIILGKANLGFMGSNINLNVYRTEGANPGFSMSGGLTRSPYDGQHPCGSSSGSAVSVSAGFSPVSIGTETMGSISCPASFNSVYGLKPSTGLVSWSGVLPCSISFDTPGVMAKSTRDLAIVLNAIAGPDPDDEATLADGGCSKQDYTKGLFSSWSEMRIGFADNSVFWDDDTEDSEEGKQMLNEGKLAGLRMRELGALVIDNVSIPSIEHISHDSLGLMMKIIHHEMKKGYDEIFPLMESSDIKSMADLVAFNNLHHQSAFKEGFGRQEVLEETLAQNISLDEYNAILRKAHVWAVEQGIFKAMETNGLDALVVPGGSWMPVYASFAKQPTLTVPLGKYPSGKPHGLTLVGRRCADHRLLQLSQLYERDFPPRLVPQSMRWKRFMAYVPNYLAQDVFLN